MKYRIIENDFLRRYFDKEKIELSILPLKWSIYFLLIHSGFKINKIEEIEENEIYWWCDDTLDTGGYFVKHDGEYYLFYAENDDEYIEDNEEQLYELLNGESELDIFTALTFLTI